MRRWKRRRGLAGRTQSNVSEFLSADGETQATSKIIEEVVAEDETLADYLRIQLVDLSPDADLRALAWL